MVSTNRVMAKETKTPLHSPHLQENFLTQGKSNFDVTKRARNSLSRNSLKTSPLKKTRTYTKSDDSVSTRKKKTTSLRSITSCEM